jgi:hypothetical protein
LVEVAIDGGDAALAALIAHLPPRSERSALPTRVRTLLDGLIEAPPEIASHVASTSRVRLVMARIDGETRSAVAVELDEPSTASRGDGPRHSARVGDRAAVDGSIAVVSDDPAMLDQSFAYLAYTALDERHDDGIEVRLPASTLASAVRAALEQTVREARGNALASIAAARAAHDRPPDLGDPDALVGSLADATMARIAYLPDLGDATITLHTSPSGLAVTATAAITPASPLARAIAGAAIVPHELASALPASSALVLASGLASPTPADVVEQLAALGGSRLDASERTGLDDAARTIASVGGTVHAIAIGASEAGPSLAVVTLGATDAALPAPWGRAYPWTTALLGAAIGCTPTSSRTIEGDRTICDDVVLATRGDATARTDVIGRDAPTVADATQSSFVLHAAASSPDLARDLDALDASTWAIAIARPLRALPLVAREASSSLPRGDGAIVLAASQAEGALRIDLRASTAALADLATVVDLFTNGD